jgi:TonB family protein
VLSLSHNTRGGDTSFLRGLRATRSGAEAAERGKRWGYLLLLSLSLFASPSLLRAADSPRLAILPFVGDEAETFRGVFSAEMLQHSGNLELLDEDQVYPALKNTRPNNLLNLSRDEARRLGMSVGCDFFVTGKAIVSRRIEVADQFFFEAVAGLFLVEVRSGRLIKFAFHHFKAEQEDAARRQLAAGFKVSGKDFRQAVAASRTRDELNPASDMTPGGAEALDLTQGTPPNVSPPFFYQRLKPQYTDEARLGGIAATVELEVIFRSDGQVGEIKVVRWAGFGLDEAAVATARQLKFKPAEVGGRAVSARAVVRYNFN